MNRNKFRIWDTVTRSFGGGILWSLRSDGVIFYGNAKWEEGIVEHCTGLKDESGTYIYEGDVLRCVCEDLELDYQTKVYAVGNTLCVDTRGQEYDYNAIDFADEYWSNDNYNIYIIGNIHDSEELNK